MIHSFVLLVFICSTRKSNKLFLDPIYKLRIYVQIRLSVQDIDDEGGSGKVTINMSIPATCFNHFD